MTIKKRVKNLIENITYTYILRGFPRGVNVIHDIKKYLPRYRGNVIFDVGANIGQLAEYFLRYFSESQVYCFEPIMSTFNDLYNNFGNKGNVHCFHLALGAFNGKGRMVLKGSSDKFFLSSQPEELFKHNNADIEVVDIERLDDFCRLKDIKQINYLKIDTEGHDLEVLKGAQLMLNQSRIELIELEAGMNYKNSRHVPLEDLKRFLEASGYLIFGIYDQVQEWPTGEPHLRRVNPVFISQGLVEANKQSEVALHG